MIEVYKSSNADILVGSRFLMKDKLYKFPRHRYIGNIVLTFFTNLASRKKATTDSQSGYRILSRRFLESAVLFSPRMSISSEIIIEAAHKNFKIEETAIEPTYEDEISNQRLVIDTTSIIKTIFLCALRGKSRRNYSMDYDEKRA